MKIELLTALLFSLFLLSGHAPDGYPTDDFRAPVAGPLRLSGTFGELRSNHFHSGIDIKSRNGRTGDPLFACADGHVSRIKIEGGGYGNALYIDHPNGFTTVYAHLERYYPELSLYIKQQQYEQQSFELDIYPERGQFPVTKGQVVGAMGVSGTSFGPHLHFEIRETDTEKAVNPLLFGLEVPDREPPRIHELKVYSLDRNLRAWATRKPHIGRVDTDYRLHGDTLQIGARQAGFGIKTYDRMSYVSNMNGVYAIRMYQDDELVYSFRMEKFAFDETRYINAHLDYAEQVSARSYFNRLYLLPGNELSAYEEAKDRGVITLEENQTSEIRMVVEDFAGNDTEMRFWVKRKEVKPVDGPVHTYLLPWDEESLIETPSLQLYFPKGTLYENLYMQYQASTELSDGVYSAVHHVHDYKTPVHQYYDIAIRPLALPEEKRDQAFIAYCDQRNRVYNCGGVWKDGMLHAQVRDLGDFSIMVDERPPSIKPVRFQSNMRGQSRMVFEVRDNYRTARNVDGLRYRARLNGEWILMEYDKKNHRLTHYFDGRFDPGQYELVLEVWDVVGNRSVWQRSFSL